MQRQFVATIVQSVLFLIFCGLIVLGIVQVNHLERLNPHRPMTLPNNLLSVFF